MSVQHHCKHLLFSFDSLQVLDPYQHPQMTCAWFCAPEGVGTTESSTTAPLSSASLGFASALLKVTIEVFLHPVWELTMSFFSWVLSTETFHKLFSSWCLCLVMENTRCCSWPCKPARDTRARDVSMWWERLVRGPSISHQVPSSSLFTAANPLLVSHLCPHTHFRSSGVYHRAQCLSQSTASHSLGQVQERQTFQCLSLITRIIYWLPHLSIDCYVRT